MIFYKLKKEKEIFFFSKTNILKLETSKKNW